jgi:hypothetical protein
MKTIEMMPTLQETISLQDFVRLTEEEKTRIESVQIQPPLVGRKGFGRVIVTYKSPIYKLLYGKQSQPTK